MKRFLCILLMLLLCPVSSFAELDMDVANNYIAFPALDEMTGYFRQTSTWTIVHSGNLDEHMALLLRRGDTEEEVRARFAEETLLWEAYNPGFPEDACIRMERFVNETSRSVWHLRHLSTGERRDLLKQANDGKLLAAYDTFSAKYAGSGGTAYMECSFTTIPPAVHESGKMHIRYINGQEYVLTYAVRERMAGRSKLRSARENNLIRGYSPFKSLTFGVKLLPTMPDFALNEAFPTQVDLGDLTVSGAVTQGARLAVTLDHADIPCTVDGKGAFSVSLPLTVPGDHEVVFTITHGKHTDRVEAFTVNASAHRTPLTITAKPETDALAGDHTIAGISEPGAEIVLRLDDRNTITLTADDSGGFTHTYEIMDDQVHQLYVAASAEGKDICVIPIFFYTEYETFKDGTDAFEAHLTKRKISELAADPSAYLGERVKISVRINEVVYTEEGLGILCAYNPPKGSRHEKTPLYLTFYGYAQDQLQPGMIVTIYGTVRGQKELPDESRLHIFVQYGTYLVTRK